MYNSPRSMTPRQTTTTITARNIEFILHIRFNHSLTVSASTASEEPRYVREDVLCRFCGQFHEKSGPHLYDYAGEVDDDFNCHICLQPLVNPVDTACSHTFCLPCLKSHLRFQKSCPIDRNSLTTKEIRPSTILVNKLLDKLVVVCPNTEFCQEQCQRSVIRQVVSMILISDKLFFIQPSPPPPPLSVCMRFRLVRVRVVKCLCY